MVRHLLTKAQHRKNYENTGAKGLYLDNILSFDMLIFVSLLFNLHTFSKSKLLIL